MKVRKITENVYFFPGFTNVGAINARTSKKENGNLSSKSPETENHIYLIDSGTDRKDAENIISSLESIFPEGFKIEAVINTHGHSDHVGGNGWLQKNLNAEIWIPERETPIASNFCSNVNYIWGGDALPELKMWFSLKETFSPSRFIKPGEKIILPDKSELTFIELYGHSLAQIGIQHKSADGKKVLFTGDAYLGLDELFKSKISFQEEPLKALSTMKSLLDINADFFIQSHGMLPATRDEVKETISANIRSLEKTIAYINYILDKKPLTTEIITAKIINKFRIYVKTVNFTLVYSTIKSLLSELYAENRIGVKIKEGFLYWTKTR